MTTIRTGNRRHRKKMLRQTPEYRFWAYIHRTNQQVYAEMQASIEALMPLIYNDDGRQRLEAAMFKAGRHWGPLRINPLIIDVGRDDGDKTFEVSWIPTPMPAEDYLFRIGPYIDDSAEIRAGLGNKIVDD